jgi:glycosyltransferase involved in cell wall biosynthesis
MDIFGGSEVRAWLFATGLAAKPSFRVTCVVFDHGQPRTQMLSGVDVVAHGCYPRAQKVGLVARTARRVRRAAVSIGVPLTPRSRGHGAELHGQWYEAARMAPYEDIAADAYCVFGVGDQSAEVAAYCKSRSRTLVLFLGSENDLSEHFQPLSRSRDRYGSRSDLGYAVLKSADVVVAQSSTQADRYQARFGRPATVIRNPIQIAKVERAPDRAPARRGYVLWVGKSDSNKRPEVFLELARRAPSQSFVMVLNRSDPAIFARAAAERPSNVQLLERVTFRDSDALFAGASALVNTSEFEGFPNTFLQAAKHHVPIVSLVVDPDGILSANSCGVVAKGSFDMLTQSLLQILADPLLRERLTSAMHAYVEREHESGAQVEKLAKLLLALDVAGEDARHDGD